MVDYPAPPRSDKADSEADDGFLGEIKVSLGKNFPNLPSIPIYRDSEPDELAKKFAEENE